MAKTSTANKTELSIPKVYAFGVINEGLVSRLVDELNFHSGYADSIDLHLNSVGGSIYQGMAAYSVIKDCPVPVDIYIDGVAASMGAYLSFAGRKTFMSKYARVMLHEGKVGEGGSVAELREMANEVEACNNNLIAITAQKTGMSAETAKEKFFNGQDNWYSASEALALGLIDGIYDQGEVNVPAAASHTEVYAMVSDAYQNGVFKTDNNMDFKLSNEAVATLDLKPGYDVNAINTAVQTLANKNKELTGELETVKSDGLAKEVNAMLDVALTDKKISAQQKTVFAKQYAGKPEDLKEVLATMGTFVSINDKLTPGSKGEYTPKVQALMDKGWDALHKGGGLAELQELDPNAFVALYEGKYGYKPNEKPSAQMPSKQVKKK